jgi:hypothetical protein
VEFAFARRLLCAACMANEHRTHGHTGASFLAMIVPVMALGKVSSRRVLGWPSLGIIILVKRSWWAAERACLCTACQQASEYARVYRLLAAGYVAIRFRNHPCVVPGCEDERHAALS